jgi:hypothetical protein
VLVKSVLAELRPQPPPGECLHDLPGPLLTRETGRRHHADAVAWLQSGSPHPPDSIGRSRIATTPRNSGGYLPKFAWTKIVRHRLVRRDASPDDPAQAGYWAERRSRNKPLLDRRTLLRRQHGSCPICDELLLHADREPQRPREWEQWHRTTRKAITRQTLVVHGNGLPDETRFVHVSCLRRTADGQQEPAHLHS